MKAIKLIKKNKLLFVVGVIYLLLLVISPDKASKAVGNSVYYLKEMLMIMPVIFLLTVVLEALVPKEVIMKSFGKKSGFKGNVLALILGSVSAGPIYAAFPISKTMLSKGASISNIVIILSSWAVIKVPMLANEAKFLGAGFMAVRWVLTVAAIFIMANITELFIKNKDLPKNESEIKEGMISIKEEYCIGCGICSKIMPNYYKMKDKKAVVVKAIPEGKEAELSILETVKKCPAKAISFFLQS